TPKAFPPGLPQSKGGRSPREFSAPRRHAPYRAPPCRPCSSVGGPAVTGRATAITALSAIALAGASVIAGHTQHLFDGGHAFEHHSPAVGPDARARRARVADHCLLGQPGMNHAAQGVVEQLLLVDAGAPAITQLGAHIAAFGVVDRWRLARVDAEQRTVGF